MNTPVVARMAKLTKTSTSVLPWRERLFFIAGLAAEIHDVWQECMDGRVADNAPVAQEPSPQGMFLVKAEVVRNQHAGQLSAEVGHSSRNQRPTDFYVFGDVHGDAFSGLVPVVAHEYHERARCLELLNFHESRVFHFAGFAPLKNQVQRGVLFAGERYFQ